MILYLDTSSMVKLFFTEADCDATRACAGAADMLATSQVAYAETMVAFPAAIVKAVWMTISWGF